MCDPEACAGCSRQLDRLLRAAECEIRIAERVTSHDLLMALVAAGYGLGITTRTHLSLWRHPDVVSRPLTVEVPPLTTYLLRRDAEDSEQLRSFVERLRGITMPMPDKMSTVAAVRGSGLLVPSGTLVSAELHAAKSVASGEESPQLRLADSRDRERNSRLRTFSRT